MRVQRMKAPQAQAFMAHQSLHQAIFIARAFFAKNVKTQAIRDYDAESSWRRQAQFG
jgi:hypothetical protein